MLQDPNVERYVQKAMEPVLKQIKELQEEIKELKKALHKTDVVRSKIAVGDRVRVEKGNRSIYTVQHIKGSAVWFEETNDSCFVEECTKVE